MKVQPPTLLLTLKKENKIKKKIKIKKNIEFHFLKSITYVNPLIKVIIPF